MRFKWPFTLLLVIYLVLKLQGWNYGFRAHRMEKDLEQLRPVLSQIILSEQLKSHRDQFQQLFSQIEQLDMKGGRLLTWFSNELPAQVTLEKLQVEPGRLQIEGTLTPGIQDPEQFLDQWAQRLQADWPQVKVQSLVPDSQRSGGWRFQILARKGIDD